MDNRLLNDYMNHSNKYNFSKLITKILLSIMLLLISLIFVKNSDKNGELLKKYLFTDTFDFSTFQNIYNNIKGNNDIVPVMSNTKLTNKTKYKDGYSFHVNDSLIECLSSGIVVYIGQKENYNNTVIIQGSDGYDIWYGNLDDVNVSIYDYLNKDTIIGQSDTLYIKIMKDGKVINLDDYISL